MLKLWSWLRAHPNGHATLRQRRIDFDATLYKCPLASIVYQLVMLTLFVYILPILLLRSQLRQLDTLGSFSTIFTMETTFLLLLLFFFFFFFDILFVVLYSRACHYENTPIQIYCNFTTKKGKFSDKKFWYFHKYWYFSFRSKHRLWVLVRTAMTRRF